MLSKISNVASREGVEAKLNAAFTFPHLYSPSVLINGIKETSVCIVTSESMNSINFGIWGILPMGYENGWKDFQSEKNTLNVDVDSLELTPWLMESFHTRKCLVISTGYYLSKIENFKMRPYHTTMFHNEVFCFAGIYTILDDGFHSFGILTREDKSTNIINQPTPIIIKQDSYKDYLTNNITISDLQNLELKIDAQNFMQFPVSRELYKE